MSKILKMKAIHNYGAFLSFGIKAVVSDVKDTENESNSQPLEPICAPSPRCCV